MRRVVYLTIMTIGLSWMLSGCEFSRQSRPAVLVIAVEGLSFDTINCDADADAFEALRVFCEESVRFSHAFTPSTMSQAAMTSLLTGLYPFDHLVRHNGDDFLSARIVTLAERALEKRYHTLFVSGGPPIWRKSGLAQGFEVFDDTMDLPVGTYYRPAGEVFRLAIQWMDQFDDGRPAFAVTFLSDLQFPEISTRTDDGEVRAKGIESQIDEVLESLNMMVKWLKSKRKWNSTNIVLVGLNAMPAPEIGEPSTLSMRSRASQVSLFIKPARKERDNVIQWAVDRNVSLVDVGHTMFTWLKQEPPESSLVELKAQDLSSALVNSEPRWREGRIILSETAWPDWLEGSGVRWALRQRQFLYIHDENQSVYNTLTDRLENLPLKSSDPLWNSLNSEVIGLLGNARMPAFKGMNSHWPEMLGAAHQLWNKGPAPMYHSTNEQGWAKWLLREALLKKDWRQVKRYSQDLGEPVGSFVAARHMGERLPMPRNPCVRLMLAKKANRKNYHPECEDERVLALYAWQEAGSDEERFLAEDRFLRLHGHWWMDQEIGRMNYLNDLRWHVDREWPGLPETADYLLTLKEFEPYARRASAFLNAKNIRL